jgi:hypothetical protein
MIKENKVSKYLLYAIGEIILVVIGILIALQINNWNENRKIQNTQNLLLIDLYDNLRADSIVLDNNRRLILIIIESQKQLHAVRIGKLQPDDVKSPQSIRGSIRNYSITRANHPDVATQVFNDSLQDQIREYYRLLASSDNAYKQYDDIVKKTIRPYLAENFALNPNFLFENQKDFREANLLNLDNFYPAIEKEYFGQILFEANMKAVELSEYFTVLLKANEVLRKTVKNEIDEE